jgi:peroxiredoxin
VLNLYFRVDNRVYKKHAYKVEMEKLNALPKDVLINMPANLPIPEDDGGCDHLLGLRLPNMNIQSTSSGMVNLVHQTGWVVIYCYPMTGRPGQVIPDGWASIPGAAGCTPQSCSFRDRHGSLVALGAKVFGMSAQSTADQIEAVHRLRLPYELLSDSALLFARRLKLPVFETAGMILLKRVTLVVEDGIIRKYFYPVFPPDRNVDEVLSWLRLHTA